MRSLGPGGHTGERVLAHGQGLSAPSSQEGNDQPIPPSILDYGNPDFITHGYAFRWTCPKAGAR